jgi:hypothetical protein
MRLQSNLLKKADPQRDPPESKYLEVLHEAAKGIASNLSSRGAPVRVSSSYFHIGYDLLFQNERDPKHRSRVLANISSSNIEEQPRIVFKMMQHKEDLSPELLEDLEDSLISLGFQEWRDSVYTKVIPAKA